MDFPYLYWVMLIRSIPASLGWREVAVSGTSLPLGAMVRKNEAPSV